MTAHALNRRVPRATAATAAGLFTARTAPAADDFAGFNVGVQSYTFREFDLEQMLKKTKELGLKNAEFFSKRHSSGQQPGQTQVDPALCKEYEVAPVGFGVSGFSKNNDANKKMFDFGKAIGVKYLSCQPLDGRIRQPRQAVR